MHSFTSSLRHFVTALGAADERRSNLLPHPSAVARTLINDGRQGAPAYR